MSYGVVLENRVQKEIRALSPSILKRIDLALQLLANNPRPRGAKKLHGKTPDGWRLRVGDYRILYTIDDLKKAVRVYRIRHRREVYS